jgi:replicative DNA helicase
MHDPVRAAGAEIAPAEQEVIAHLLADNDRYDTFGLSRDHFTDHACQRIFAVAAELIERGERADEVTVAPYLDEKQRRTVANLVDLRGDPAALPDYLRLLRRGYQQRGLAALSADMAAASGDQQIDPDQLIEGYQDRLDEMRGVTARSEDTAIGSSAARVFAAAAEAYQSGRPPGLKTGISLVDDKLQPMRAGQLIVVGGAAGHGKSVFGATVSRNLALQGIPSLLLSLEMKDDDFAQRLLAGETGIDIARIISGDLSEAEFRALKNAEGRLHDWPLTVESPKRLTASMLVRLARQYIRKRGIRLVTVDHIGLMHGRGRSSYEQMSDITRSLKEAALELDIPILALAQLNREPARRADAKDWNERYMRRRPKKSDLRDSGSIEQDADVVLLLHREEEYAANEEPPLSDAEYHENWERHMERHAGRVDIAVAKQRQGSVGMVNCDFDGARFRIQ